MHRRCIATIRHILIHHSHRQVARRANRGSASRWAITRTRRSLRSGRRSEGSVTARDDGLLHCVWADTTLCTLHVDWLCTCELISLRSIEDEEKPSQERQEVHSTHLEGGTDCYRKYNTPLIVRTHRIDHCLCGFACGTLQQLFVHHSPHSSEAWGDEQSLTNIARRAIQNSTVRRPCTHRHRSCE